MFEAIDAIPELAFLAVVLLLIGLARFGWWCGEIYVWTERRWQGERNGQ